MQVLHLPSYLVGSHEGGSVSHLMHTKCLSSNISACHSRQGSQVLRLPTSSVKPLILVWFVAPISFLNTFLAYPLLSSLYDYLFHHNWAILPKYIYPMLSFFHTFVHTNSGRGFPSLEHFRFSRSLLYNKTQCLGFCTKWEKKCKSRLISRDQTRMWNRETKQRDSILKHPWYLTAGLRPPERKGEEYRGWGVSGFWRQITDALVVALV